MASDAEAEAFTQVVRRGDAVEDVDAWVWRAAFRIATGMLDDRPTIRHEPPDPPGVTASGSTAEFLDLLAGLSAQQRACITLPAGLGCPSIEGTVSWQGTREEGLAAAALGPAPFLYDVLVTLDGVEYRTRALWPADELPESSPAVRSTFDPPLPALGD